MKKLQKNIIFALVAVFALSLNSCKKDDTNKPGTVTLKFNYVFGSSSLPWSVNQSMRHPKTGDTLSFSEFSFYISKIHLQKENGTWWAQPASYHLIAANNAQPGVLKIDNVPSGNYKAIEFMLGIDSAGLTSAASAGTINSGQGMYWNNLKEYYMIKAEGVSPQSASGTFAFHLGGYTQPFQIYESRKSDFKGTTLAVSESSSPSVVFQANVGRLWHTTPGVSEINSVDEPGETAYTMALNFYSSVVFLELK